jgi:phage terminase small subunit
MKGGQNRKSRAEKEARGTLQECREVPDPVHADPSAVPAPPKGLTKLEREVWAELAVQVETLGTFSASDLTAFRLMVETVAETRSFDKRDPATARVRTRQVASTLLQGFGLVPVARERIPSSKKSEDPKKKAASFLFGPLQALPGGKGA